ncbi:MAG TPA: hypothetical protein VMY42_26005 [Thermoguttaceae bacterium]|nr:hypothetical protein [Thermoguttaceae bacterium]
MRDSVGSFYRFLTSMRLAVILLVILAVVLAGATFLEAGRGREYVQWHVYHSPWFSALLGLLAINILAATMVRFPWKRRQMGFVLAHVGLLVLLGGAMQTFLGGIEGQLFFAEGDTADTIRLSDRTELTVTRDTAQGQQSTTISFEAGPVDWPQGKVLDFGESDGLKVKAVNFYRHARRSTDGPSWIEDELGLGGPALKLALTDSDGQPVTLAGAHGENQSEDWLVMHQFRSQEELHAALHPNEENLQDAPSDPLRFRLLTAPTDSMLDEFLAPPDDDLGEQGLLSMHHEGRVYRVPVQENVGKRVPVGESGIEVEIVEYLPNARLAGHGRSGSLGDEPKNPLLELLVHVSDREEPMREIARAKVPFQRLDGAYGWDCPVKFWYHHPAISAPEGAEFLHVPDGRLYCRVGQDGSYRAHGEVKSGDRIETAADVTVSIVEYFPHAREQVTFEPVELEPGESSLLEAAALVQVTAEGATRHVWLQRDGRQYGFRWILTPEGPVRLTLGYEQLPLGFSLKLVDFTRGKNPGQMMGDASFVSSVQLVDAEREIDEQHEISMNRPLTHGRFTFYQSRCDTLSDGRDASYLTAAYDPGRLLKYFGSVMLCVGIFVMCFMKAYLSRKTSSRSKAAAGPPHWKAAGREVRAEKRR